jgi:hypothetical protein
VSGTSDSPNSDAGFDGFDGFEHPDLASIGAAMRAEWRIEEELATADAVEQWRHGRTFADWLTERMIAGDEVALDLGERRFTGRIVEVGHDLLSLRGRFGRVDVHLTPSTPLQLVVVERSTAAGARPVLQRTFRDALVPRQGRGRVTVATTLEPSGIDGELFVGLDFVTIAVAGGGPEVAVPVESVLWVARTED